MKRIIIIFIAVITSFSAYSQTNLQDGDRCFDSGDYICAIEQYDKALKNASGDNKQIPEIKLSRAKRCAELIEAANKAFNSKNYTTAKDGYLEIIDRNPKDSYAKSQLEKCENALKQPATPANNPSSQPQKNTTTPNTTKPTTTKLTVSQDNVTFNSTGGSIMLDVNTNASSYTISNLPSWCKVNTKQSDWFKLECNVNNNSTERKGRFKVTAGGKEVIISVTQAGKTQNPQKPAGQETTLSISTKNLSFMSQGGTSERIRIYSNAETYSVTSTPNWCNVQSYNGYFIVNCNENYSETNRDCFLTVTAADKSLRIYIYQSGNKSSCFNCPKTHDSWGLTLGFAPKSINNSFMDCAQIGIKFEPLFKYGFGLNTGLILEGYSDNIFENDFYFYAINIPLHLEYRLNFHKWFNMYFYGGVGVNAISDSDFEDYDLPVTLEYGGGIRFNKIQLSVGRKNYLGNFRNVDDFGQNIDPYMNWVFSTAIMF